MNYTYKMRVSGIEEIEAGELGEIKNGCIAAYADSLDNGEVHNMIMNNNKIVLLIKAGEERTGSVILNVAIMIKYMKYDIYEVNENDIDEQYIIYLSSRESSLSEVARFIGRDIAVECSSDKLIGEILSDVTNTDETLKKIMENEETLRIIPGLIDKGNAYIEVLKLREQELNRTIEELSKNNDVEKNSEILHNVKVELGTVKDALEKSNKTSEELRNKLKEQEEENNRLKEEIKKAKEVVVAQPERGFSGGIIKDYQAVNTKLLACKTMATIYFKELSYVPYTSTLVLALMEVLKKAKLNIITLVYDDKADMSRMYNTQNVVGYSEFRERKATLLASELMIVLEPVQNILEDVLTNESKQVVIIYDRMRKKEDLVQGNTVYKFVVANSMNEVNAMQDIPMSVNNIITRDLKAIKGGAMSLPYIKELGNSGCSKSLKANKYLIGTEDGKESTLMHILKTSNLETVLPRANKR